MLGALFIKEVVTSSSKRRRGTKPKKVGGLGTQSFRRTLLSRLLRTISGKAVAVLHRKLLIGRPSPQKRTAAGKREGQEEKKGCGTEGGKGNPSRQIYQRAVNVGGRGSYKENS